MIDRTKVLERHPLVPYLESRGVTIRAGKTNRCAEVEHKPQHLCVTVNEADGIWYCHDCERGGSVIDWEMLSAGISAVDAIKRLSGEAMPEAQKTFPVPSSRNGGGNPRMVKAYDYTDEAGGLLYQVCRFEPKDFRQRVPVGDGWAWKLGDVRRVLYNLPKVLAADMVWLCEGEKDADTLAGFGFTSTTNVGGAKKWDASYSATLRGKDVVMLPDNDKAGGEHRDALRLALSPVVKSLRIVEMPQGFKDVTELVESFPNVGDGASALVDLAEKVEILYRGESVPIQTMSELEAAYRENVQKAKTHQLPLGDWLPAFRGQVRPLVPGEIFTILAGTGCGKTMFLQNLALNTRLATLLFEAELPGTLSFERFVAMATKTSGAHVESQYAVGGGMDWRAGKRLDHIMCCHESRLTPERIARVIESAELKTCVRPVLVLIDYVQLIQSKGESRYDRVSHVMEQLKIVAKETQTIIAIASQIDRASTTKDTKETREVTLTSGKESGSIENSSGLVLGGWRDGGDNSRLWLRVLKNTKGVAGLTVPCRINESLLIHQEAQEP